MHLNSINGKYFRSFFTIKAETDENIDTILSPETIDMVVHEYVHYIQDISTVYGLINMSNNFNDIAHFYNIEEDIIKIPYVINNSYLRKTNADLFSVYFNHCNEDKFPKFEAQTTIKQIPVSEIGMEGFDALKYYEVILNRDGFEKCYGFGACAIMESMASLIERHLFPIEEKSYYHLPYDLCTIVVLKKYLKLAKNLGFIAALCDISLMFYHPGEIFIEVLEEMNKENYMPQKIIDVYNFVISYIRFEDRTYDDIWTDSFERSIKNINNVVNVKEYEFAKDWAINNIKHYYEKRRNDNSFITKIFSMNNKDALQYVYTLMAEIISPLIYNNKYQFCNIANPQINQTDDHEKLYYWFDLGKMFEYIFKKGGNCPFLDQCQYTCKYYSKPFKNKNQMKNGFCVFQQFSRVFGLYKREVKE
ncbi:hypothetical protein [Treponema pedis]|uniref:hypothetical protein n=1 Tax=Treponema pedis TaxID=409322 RepID=UPI0004136AD1|nr:hypothetical protein [Treponema pedis]